MLMCVWISSVATGICDKTIKLSLQQAVKAHRDVKRRGLHILSRQSAHRWRQGFQPYAPATFYPQEDS
jgi:hypothetical protein